MSEGDHYRSLSSGAPTLLIVITLGLAAGVLFAILSGRSRLATQAAAVVMALATILLVAITTRYLASTRQYLDRTRKEQHRPYVKRVIVDGIDTVLDWLDANRERWAVADPPSGLPVYPEIEDVRVPESVVADIARDHPDLVKEVGEFTTAARAYRSQWLSLADDLEAHIGTEFRPEGLPETVGDVVPPAYADLPYEGSVPLSASPERLLAEHPEWFGRQVLTNDPLPAADRERLDDDLLCRLLLDDVRRVLVGLRGDERFADRIERLHESLATLKADADAVESGLREAREGYIEDYEIMETELGELAEGGRPAV